MLFNAAPIGLYHGVGVCLRILTKSRGDTPLLDAIHGQTNSLHKFVIVEISSNNTKETDLLE